MKKYFLPFAVILSFFALLPKPSSAALEMEVRGGWPSQDFPLLKGVSSTSISFSIFNNSSQPIESPTTLYFNFFVDNEPIDSLSKNIDRDIGAFESHFNTIQDALDFRLEEEATLNLGDNYELMVTLKYENQDSTFMDTIVVQHSAIDPSPTLDLALNEVSTDAENNIDIQGDRAIFTATITNVDPNPFTFPPVTPINIRYTIEENYSSMYRFILDRFLEQNQTFVGNFNIRLERIEEYLEEKGSVDICFYLDFPLDVNPDNDTLCATYFLEGNTSREKPSLIGQLQHFPNPTKSHTQIQWHNQEAGQVEVQLLNLQGQVLLQQNLGLLPEGLQEFQLDLQNFPKGAYFYTLHLNGEIAHGKIIKQ